MRVVIGIHLQVSITNIDSNLWDKPCVFLTEYSKFCLKIQIE